jgi:hypothetical protein
MNDEHLSAVASRLSETIVDFCNERVGETFFADDLRRYVVDRAGHTAPGSADRILRELRARGALGYVVLNRAKSLYRIDWVGEGQGLL